jgi:hypothetical protein
MGRRGRVLSFRRGVTPYGHSANSEVYRPFKNKKLIKNRQTLGDKVQSREGNSPDLKLRPQSSV